MKKIIIILISLTTALGNLYCQYADPYISIIVSPALISLNGTATLSVSTGNSGNDTIATNTLRIEITVGSNVEITGFSSSTLSDPRWTINTLSTGAGNTVTLINSAGGFGSFDLANINLTLVGRTPSEPITITGTIGYLPGFFPNGAPYWSQGNAGLLNDFSQTSASVSIGLEDCLNNMDDDNDGFIDCQDGDCSLSGVNGSYSLSVSPMSASICEGDTVELISSISNLPANHPYIGYTWLANLPGYPAPVHFNTQNLSASVECWYYLTVTNMLGCTLTSDTIYVTVTDIDPSVIQTNSTLMAVMPDAEYQWIDCDNAASPIAGATGQVFNPTQNGSYAVVVTKNGCSETSSCSIVNTVGTTSLEKENGVTIYPNPFTDELHLTFEKAQTDTKLNIFGADGKLIKKLSVFGNTATVETSDFPKGMYILQVINADKTMSVLIKAQ